MDRGEQQRQEAHSKRIADLRDRMHRKVAYYAQKPVVEPAQLYHLVREFFLSLIEKEYEPTYEEIIQELEELDHEFLFFTKHQRATVRELLQELSRMHYSNEQMNQEQAQDVLAQLKEVITDLTTHTQGSLDHVLHAGLRALADKDKQKAREAYMQARSMVEKLDDSQRKQYRPELEELYSGLQN